MITLKFSKHHNWNNLEVIELKTFKDFFDFYIKNYNKGLIYDVKDDGATK
ncbi:hypothetical protein [Ruminiclostridium josui]|nr:hypothetical protein [Ruminiclostridium josui]